MMVMTIISIVFLMMLALLAADNIRLAKKNCYLKRLLDAPNEETRQRIRDEYLEKEL